MSYIEDRNKPSNFIWDEIAEKKSDKLTAKQDIINVLNDEARKKILNFLENNNWIQTKTISFYNNSRHGGSCLFFTQINDEWKLLTTQNVVRAIKTANGLETMITLFVRLVEGNVGTYFLYETHTKGRIYREAHTADGKNDGISPQEAFAKNDEVPWDSFRMDTGMNLKKEVVTPGVMTAFILYNKLGGDGFTGIFGKPDSYGANTEIELLDDAWASLTYTLRFARTRIVIRKSSGSVVTNLNAETEGDKILDGGVIVIEDNNGYDNESSPYTMLDPNPETIRNAWTSLEKAHVRLYTRIGLANPDDSDSAQKSQIEVSQIRDSEHTALEKAIILTQSTFKRMLQTLGKLLGVEVTEDDGWDIQRLDVRQETEILDNLIKLYQEGWITLEKAVSRANNISIQEAKGIIKKVKKEKKDKVKEMEKVAPAVPSQQEPEVTPGATPEPKEGAEE